MPEQDKPIVLITGAGGRDGSRLREALATKYRVVGMDRRQAAGGPSIIPFDLTADASVAQALRQLRDSHGGHLAGVIHLAEVREAAGERGPKLATLNVDGTQRLLDRLSRFKVDRFVLASTMLVHRSGDAIDEDSPIEPHGAYAASKAAAERVVQGGASSFAILRLAHLYDDRTVDAALARQIVAIRERAASSHLHAGSVAARQSMLHRDDLVSAVERVLERRTSLPHGTTMLLGEPNSPSYRQLQDSIGEALHGETWRTLLVPAALAGIGAWARDKILPRLPAALGGSDAPPPPAADPIPGDYTLDTSRAAALLGWQPHRRLLATLPTLLRALKRDPSGWYEANALPPPSL